MCQIQNIYSIGDYKKIIMNKVKSSITGYRANLNKYVLCVNDAHKSNIGTSNGTLITYLSNV